MHLNETIHTLLYTFSQGSILELRVNGSCLDVRMSEQEDSPNVNAISNHVHRIALPQRVGMRINADHPAILFDQMPHVPCCEWK